MTNEPLRELPDFERRMAAARARASWELGDPTWADVLVGAFLDPARDHQIPTQDTTTGREMTYCHDARRPPTPR